MKKIAMIGACITRDTFNSKFVPGWRETFDISLYRFQSSIISITSKPIPFSRRAFPAEMIRTYWGKMLYYECIKDYYNQLLSVSPDIILLDFYSDAYNGVIKINDYSFITNRTKDYDSKVPFFKSLILSEELNIYNEYTGFMTLWKNSFDIFYAFLKEYLPNAEVIINSARAEKLTKHADGSITSDFEKVKIDLINKAWEEMDRYAIEKYELLSLNYENGPYYIDPDYIYGGKWIVHVHKRLQNETYEKLKYLSQHMNSSNIKLKDNLNIIMNANLKEETLFWKFWPSSFKLEKMEEEMIVSLYDVQSKTPKYHQLLCNDVETDGLKSVYTVSFDCMVDDKDMLHDDHVIFLIRQYKEFYMLSAKEALKDIKISLDDSCNEGQWIHYSYTFQIITGAKYISIGPFCTQNGNLKWKNISMVVGDNEATSHDSVAETMLLDEKDRLIDVNTESILNYSQIKIM